jgi:O-acetyl-ADP-ribose deacetylase (regulator of RNase III)
VRIEVVVGDLTAEGTDAIVNAANSSLLGGGGVDGAIHAAAGPALLEACRALRATALPEGLPTGEAVTTPGFDLPAAHVIHTVGPVHAEHPDGGAPLLARCHVSVLREADRLGLRSVSLPAISCGAYGWRHEAAAPVAVAAVRSAWTSVDLVRFVLRDERTAEPWRAAVAATEPGAVTPG